MHNIIIIQSIISYIFSRTEKAFINIFRTVIQDLGTINNSKYFI